MAEGKEKKTQLSPFWKRVQRIMLIATLLIVAVAGYIAYHISNNEEDQPPAAPQEASENYYK